MRSFPTGGKPPKRPGGGRPQLISEHGAGQQANKKPRTYHVAGLRKADQIEKVKRAYTDHPARARRQLRQLGLSKAQIRQVHLDSAGSRGHGGAAQPLSPARPKTPKADYPGASFHGPGWKRDPLALPKALDTTIGAVIGVKPSRIPHNLAHSGPTNERRALDNPDVGIVPFFGRGAGRVLRSKATITKAIKFPDEMPGHVRSAAGRLASQLDKESVKKLRAEQDRLYTEERGKRARVAHAAMLKHAGTEKASRIAKSKLAGELPKVPVSKVLGEMSGKDMNVLRHYIHTNERLPFFDKLNAEDALNKGLSGHPLTEGERVLLHKTFGKEFATRVERPSLGTRAMRVAGEVANLPRSIESSFDVSAPFRQGLVAGARHPAIAAKNFGPMLKAAGRDSSYQRILREVEQHPNYELMRRAKLALTDVGSAGDREEFYPSHLGDKIPGVKQSGRAYTGYLTKTRADVFNKHIDLARKAGVDVNDRHFLESLGRFVNSATGRGDLKTLAGAAKVLNATLFSPRLLKSRLDFMNPAYYARLHPYARKEALRSALQLLALGTAVLETASKAGAGVELDPRSSDFGKMRFGDTRIDIWGGFQPVVRTLAQLASGERKTTTTGELVPLDGKFGHSSRLDVFENFIRGKLAPVPSVGADVLKGSTFVGQPVTVKGEAAQRLTPFGIQDALDVHHGGHSALESAGAYGLSAVGVGVQNYANDPTKRTADAYKKFKDEFNQALERSGSQLDPELKWRLQAREERAAQSLKAGRTEADHYAADVTLLVRYKSLSASEAKETIAWARSLPDNKLNHQKISNARSYLTRHYFDPDGMLSKAVTWLRKNGSPNLALP